MIALPTEMKMRINNVIYRLSDSLKYHHIIHCETDNIEQHLSVYCILYVNDIVWVYGVCQCTKSLLGRLNHTKKIKKIWNKGRIKQKKEWNWTSTAVAASTTTAWKNTCTRYVQRRKLFCILAELKRQMKTNKQTSMSVAEKWERNGIIIYLFFG